MNTPATPDPFELVNQTIWYRLYVAPFDAQDIALGIAQYGWRTEVGKDDDLRAYIEVQVVEPDEFHLLAHKLMRRGQVYRVEAYT
jgi:hypothetical protein